MCAFGVDPVESRTVNGISANGNDVLEVERGGKGTRERTPLKDERAL
jgi:hypothetical protein